MLALKWEHAFTEANYSGARTSGGANAGWHTPPHHPNERRRVCGCRRVAYPSTLSKRMPLNLRVARGTSLRSRKGAGLDARLSTTAVTRILQSISASEYSFCTSSVRTYSCALDTRIITSCRTQKNEASQKFARRSQPPTAVAATNSNRHRISTRATATSSVQRPPQLRTNAPSRTPYIPTLRSSTYASTNNRKVSNQRPSDSKSP
jgi:hypothetical protein